MAAVPQTVPDAQVAVVLPGAAPPLPPPQALSSKVAPIRVAEARGMDMSDDSFLLDFMRIPSSCNGLFRRPLYDCLCIIKDSGKGAHSLFRGRGDEVHGMGDGLREFV